MLFRSGPADVGKTHYGGGSAGRGGGFQEFTSGGISRFAHGYLVCGYGRVSTHPFKDFCLYQPKVAIMVFTVRIPTKRYNKGDRRRPAGSIARAALSVLRGRGPIPQMPR